MVAGFSSQRNGILSRSVGMNERIEDGGGVGVRVVDVVRRHWDVRVVLDDAPLPREQQERGVLEAAHRVPRRKGGRCLGRVGSG